MWDVPSARCSHRPWKVCAHDEKAHVDVYTRKYYTSNRENQQKFRWRQNMGLIFVQMELDLQFLALNFGTATDKSIELQTRICCTVSKRKKEWVGEWTSALSTECSDTNGNVNVSVHGRSYLCRSTARNCIEIHTADGSKYQACRINKRSCAGFIKNANTRLTLTTAFLSTSPSLSLFSVSLHHSLNQSISLFCISVFGH